MRVNEVYEGDCLDVMKELPDNCIDTILTDPPYGLSFMGKNWDSFAGITAIQGGEYEHPSPNGYLKKGGRGLTVAQSQKGNDLYQSWCTSWAKEALRIAKPGATLMAFGGTRTYHRLACAIEDAGWEIRDCVTYLNDGSQAEAALMASLDDEQLAAYLELHYPNGQCHWVYGSGMGLGYDVSKGIDKSKGAEREVIGENIRLGDKKAYPRNPSNNNSSYELGDKNGGYQTKGHVTAPATPLAAKFDGYRSRLKPSFEPIILAMKPIDKNYAHNAEKWGVSGLNIDGARVEVDENDLNKRNSTGGYGNNGNGGVTNFQYNHTRDATLTTGRYPANIIHDSSEQVEAEFAKAGVRKSGVAVGRNASKGKVYGNGKGLISSPKGIERIGHYDTGTPSRFFATCPPDIPRFIYNSKASPAERATPGNNHPTQKPLSLIRELAKLTKPPDGGVVLDPFAGSGTTGLAALAEGRDYILIEKEPEYCEIIKRRIAEYTGQEIAPKEVEIKGETVKQIPLW